ncbi:MAG TPA: hypothetical protein VGK20_12385 [Candidatus Binatia bacterium]
MRTSLAARLGILFALVASMPPCDLDGSCNPNDNCPATFNPDQADADNNGIGDACQGPCSSAPLGSCQAATRASLLLKNKSDDQSDALKLSFTGDTAQDQSVFGNPTETTETSLCLYYDGALQVSYDVPASATLWADSPAGRGWKYTDKAATAAGVTSLGNNAAEMFEACDAAGHALLVPSQLGV